jgi:uncharacterized protein (TIGR02145 family)
MKNITTTLKFIVLMWNISAQPPQAFKYQAVARDTSGSVLVNQSISFRVGIMQDSVNGMLVYSETYIATTNQFGLVNLEIGNGIIISGIFADIAWQDGPYFLKIEMDASGGTNYQFIGVSQILSVPYALYSSATGDTSMWIKTGNNIYFKKGNVGIGIENADNSSILELNSNSKGLLIPRMTANQRISITLPASGRLVFQTDEPSGFYFYEGTKWVGLADSESLSGCIDFDGNAYPTMFIGNHQWMAESLRVTHFQNGEAIPNITDGMLWSNLTSGAYCWYENNQVTNAKFGALYNWFAVYDNRKLCPAGWHVPSDQEWYSLAVLLGGENIAWGKLKSVNDVWQDPNLDATNISGFSGLPSGSRQNTGEFFYLGYHLFSWTATETSYNLARYRWLRYDNSQLNQGVAGKTNGFSVRCVKD